MTSRLYQPAKSAMQSGRGKTKEWVLEFAPADRADPENVMGWKSSKDTQKQVLLKFETCQEAVDYAAKHGIEYQEIPTQVRKIKPKAYADNFIKKV